MLMPSNTGAGSASIACMRSPRSVTAAMAASMRPRALCDRLGEFAPPEIIPEASQLREALPRQLLLGLQLVGQHAGLDEFALDLGHARAPVCRSNSASCARRSRSFCCRVSSVPNCSSRLTAARQTARSW